MFANVKRIVFRTALEAVIAVAALLWMIAGLTTMAADLVRSASYAVVMRMELLIVRCLKAWSE